MEHTFSQSRKIPVHTFHIVCPVDRRSSRKSRGNFCKQVLLPPPVGRFLQGKKANRLRRGAPAVVDRRCKKVMIMVMMEK